MDTKITITYTLEDFQIVSGNSVATRLDLWTMAIKKIEIYLDELPQW